MFYHALNRRVNGVIDEVLENGTYAEWIKEAQQRADELGL